MRLLDWVQARLPRPRPTPRFHANAHPFESWIAGTLMWVVETSYQELTRSRVRTPPSLRLLGLRWPCTAEDVKAAWRKGAIARHPDHGGSTAEFIAWQKTYEEALAFVLAHGG